MRVGHLPLHIFGNLTFIEQDHRRIKQRIRPMLGFKRFETAAVTIRGIELAAKIKKQQFNLKPLTGKGFWRKFQKWSMRGFGRPRRNGVTGLSNWAKNGNMYQSHLG